MTAGEERLAEAYMSLMAEIGFEGQLPSKVIREFEGLKGWWEKIQDMTPDNQFREVVCLILLMNWLLDRRGEIEAALTDGARTNIAEEPKAGVTDGC